MAALSIIIRGVAERTASAVNDWITGTKSTGMSDNKVLTRLNEEIEAGRIITELKNFAEARVPGYAGELLHRFGRDSLVGQQLRLDKIKPTGRTAEEAKEAQQTWDRQGIDTSSWADGEMPDPPEDAELDDLFTWIAVHDKNTCDVCEENHGETRTLREWSDIGIPRSGACAGEWRCRCLLVPAGTVSDGDIPDSIKVPRE